MNDVGLVIAGLAIALVAGGVATLVPGAIGRALAYALLGLAAVSACVGSMAALIAGRTFIAVLLEAHFSLRLDPLAGFFVAIISMVAAIVSVYALGGRIDDERGTGRTGAAAACAIFVASLLICLANDVLLFIFAWELLAISFYWAIVYAGRSKDAARSGYFATLITHGAGAGIILGLLVLAHVGGSFALPKVLAAGATLAPWSRAGIAVALLIGFGAKIGMLPFNAWLRLGYRSAPRTLAALMAGGAMNVGFYGLLRFEVGMAGGVGLWIAFLVIALGALGALGGIAWASAQRTVEELAAFSSVENAGIILVGIGVALVGRELSLPLIVGVGLAAALAQITAHAFAKMTLFLGASSVYHACGTTSFERLGGLARALPVTTFAVLSASASLVALPPTAGFLGEWMTLEGLMQAFRTGHVASVVGFALAGAALGVAAGIAVVAFVKCFGIGWLGAARSLAAQHAKRDGSVLRSVGLLMGTVLILGVGLGAREFFMGVAPLLDTLSHAPVSTGILAVPWVVTPVYPSFSSTSPLGLVLVVGAFSLGFALLVRLIPRARPAHVEVWTSGDAYRPWTQYTGSGFANPTRVVLDVVVRTERDQHVNPASSLSKRIEYVSQANPWFDLPWWESIGRWFERISNVVRATQSGKIAAYLSYILVFVTLLLLLYPSIRRW
ncbi:MAG: proton-conducting transporter transmembrane domain-containing protein [Vulcanimicrobiaceae bacterium]